MRVGILLTTPITNTYPGIEFEPIMRICLANNTIDGCYGKYVAGGTAVDSTTFSVVLTDQQMLQILGIIKTAGQANGSIPAGTSVVR